MSVVAKKAKHFEKGAQFAHLVAYFGYLLASTTPIQNCLDIEFQPLSSNLFTAFFPDIVSIIKPQIIFPA
jgi:hypothetical protein